MKQEQSEDRTQTITNPRLSNKVQPVVKEIPIQQSSNSGFLQSLEKILPKIQDDDKISPSYLKKQVLNSQTIHYLETEVQIRYEENSSIQESKISDLRHDFNGYSKAENKSISNSINFEEKFVPKTIKQEIEPNVHLINQNPKNCVSFQNLKRQNERPQIQRHKAQLPSLQRQNKSITQEEQEVYTSEDEFEDNFLLSGADEYKNEIILTIQQRQLKKNQSNQRQQFNHEEGSNQINYNKMEIEEENHVDKIDQNESQKMKQEKFKVNLREITLSLKDPKQKKQLRYLTPIKSLKKYILRKFEYSQGARNCQKLQISFYNLYPNQSPQIVLPITNEQNLQLILFEYLKARKNIFIRFENDGQLRKIVKRTNGIEQKVCQAQFDSDGELEDESESQDEQENLINDGIQNPSKLIKIMIKVNKTQKAKYKGKNRVRCEFCHKTNQDIESIKTCGPFYGPFYRGKIKTKYYTHLLCALWCKKVFLDDNYELQQIPQQIGRSQSKRCIYCEKKGAGLLCHGCNASMHYECGFKSCEYLWATYELFCHKCADKNRKRLQNQNNQNQSQCEDSGENQDGNNVDDMNQNQAMQIQAPNNQEELNYSSIKEEKKVKIQESQNNFMQMKSMPNINGPSLENSQASHSRTQSIQRVKKMEIISQNGPLSMDLASRIEINTQSVDIQIIQSKCKPGKQKMKISEVKIEQPDFPKNEEKSRRGRRLKGNDSNS